MTALRLNNIAFAYKKHAPEFALEQISMEIAPGKITALVGPSGCGKSTLLQLMAGFLTPQAGEMFYGDLRLSSATHVIPPEARNIGLVFQQGALFPHMSAAQNIAFGIRGNAEEKQKEAAAWLERIALSHKANTHPNLLSGGEQQRVALARAMAAKPCAMLLDEPFASLDNVLRRNLRRACHEMLMASHLPVLLVTHDADEALELADYIYVMDHGRIVQQGSPEQVYFTPVNRLVAELFGEVNVFEEAGVVHLLRPEQLEVIALEVGGWRGVVNDIHLSGSGYIITVNCADRGAPLLIKQPYSETLHWQMGEAVGVRRK